ncbi:LysR family transcriptional regulator [Neorhizobium sp. Rsf11]|uniref:LysR family transcriptional regulator n=2 Tax=Neorhizobium TaxID=1525371 RepID=A0ABV0MBX6_9HYPH|nr:LysR family transcriptional regulator [Neorhizobium petrolearium]MCC2613735.1 LysR family transcriptional regulator [Neorhizobium petrolearium]WGI72047.1 LysR family transcriptional regulator [Neorhizobium petrolearium]
MNVQNHAIPPLHDVDIRLLRIFKCVVECGGLSAAEYTLGIGRSAISKHLSDLEARLTVRLCERGRSGFSITSYGETVYRATIELLDALDLFRAQISTAKGTLTGSIDICIMHGVYLEDGNPLAQALGKFADRPGCVTLNVRSASSEEAEEAVATRRANVAVTCSNSGLAGLSYRPVGMHRFALYAAARHTLAQTPEEAKATDLADLDVVARAYLRREQRLLRGGRSTAIANDLEAGLELILSGRFVGILPEHLAKPWVATGQLVRLSTPVVPDEEATFIVYRSKSRNLPVIQTIAEDIVKAYTRAKTHIGAAGGK